MSASLIVAGVAIATAALGGTWAGINRALFGSNRCARAGARPATPDAARS